MLIGHEAQTREADMEAEKQAPLDVKERAQGCGLSFVLAALLIAVVFVLFTSAAGALR